MNEFDKVGLYDHNAESYRKVREAFKENNVVGIVHATGTGKSYNALQLAYDNKDLKTIWAVPKNAIKEHIIKSIEDNPNLVMERDFPNLEFKSYSALTKDLVDLNMDEIADLDIDLLILDEFHHTGAPVWGRIVNSIIDTHPDIKVFGMTAYTVRDRGTSYERDMALDEGNELFSDNIVSRYDLCDAMIDGVLPKPIYKNSYIKLIDMTRELEERVKKLEASGRECSEYNKILSDVKKRIHEAPNLGEIVKQNVKKNGKYIYFCPPAGEEGTNDIESIKKEAISWFKEIAGEDIVIYTSKSEMEDGGKSNRDAFYDDLDLEGNKVDNKLRVMFAINQYNEGVHAPNLDGVIMGRGTCSDIVFFEQLGRALSVSSGVKEKIELYSNYSIERLRLMCSQKNINYNYDMNKEELVEKLVAPVIIDLAGNIDFIKELENNLKDRIKEYQEKGLGTLNRRFLSDASFDLDMYEVELFNILMDLKQKTEMTWDDWYKLAEDYYKEHGNLNVPRRYVLSMGYKLGIWIQLQRQAYQNRNLAQFERKGTMAPLMDEQVLKLETIGMIWDFNQESWDKMYELAKEYYEEFGNLNVAGSYIAPNGEKLGQWIHRQRKAFQNRSLAQFERKGTMAPLKDEQVSKLESIGMIWNYKEYEWNRMYESAQKYYEEHGDLNIPKDYVTKNGERLGVWIRTQRQSYKHGNLSGEQVPKLESIGMIWDFKQESWNKMYELSQTYFEEHGDLNIPLRYVTEQGEKLGEWIINQRQSHKHGNLSDEQVSKLESIGMIWDFKQESWNKMYELAKEYYEKFDNLNVPVRYITPSGEKLGRWIQLQRQAYQNRNLAQFEKKSTMTPLTDNQVKLLENIGMIWDFNQESWDKMYELAKTYFEENGDLKIPQRYVTSNGEKLGIWVSNQRQAYKKEKLNKKQIQMLESIGMVWDSKKNKSDIEEICKDNTIDIKKNNDIINHIAFAEFKVKLAYLKDNGMDIVNNDGILHEIFSMSSMNMKLKYGVSLEDLVNMYGKEKNK